MQLKTILAPLDSIQSWKQVLECLNIDYCFLSRGSRVVLLNAVRNNYFKQPCVTKAFVGQFYASILFLRLHWFTKPRPVYPDHRCPRETPVVGQLSPLWLYYYSMRTSINTALYGRKYVFHQADTQSEYFAISIIRVFLFLKLKDSYSPFLNYISYLKRIWNFSSYVHRGS